jgi:hypothetical protein
VLKVSTERRKPHQYETTSKEGTEAMARIGALGVNAHLIGEPTRRMLR